jgi:hypothetical protein
LANVPKDATFQKLFSIIWGGQVEALFYKAGDNFATVLFLERSGLHNYLADTNNGILWPGSKNIWIDVQKDEEKSMMQVSHYQQRRSRIAWLYSPFPEGVTLNALKLLALDRSLNVESINQAIYEPENRHFVEIRFASISEAHFFRSALSERAPFEVLAEDGHWQYRQDPCFYRRRDHRR